MWNKIKKIIDEKGMTTYQLAKQSGVNKSHLSNLKRGINKNLSWDNAVKVADALGISLDELR